MDDDVHVGSSNLDIRSLYLNMELMLRVDDAEFAQLMRIISKASSATASPITPQVHKKRATFLNRMRWALSFFLVTAVSITA